MPWPSDERRPRVGRRREHDGDQLVVRRRTPFACTPLPLPYRLAACSPLVPDGDGAAVRCVASQLGELRRRRLDRDIAQLSIVQGDDDLAWACAELRHRCQKAGHALGNKIHDGDRWVAAVAVRLGVPLVCHDGVFEQTPGLELITERMP